MDGEDDEAAAGVERLAVAHLLAELIMLVEEADGLADEREVGSQVAAGETVPLEGEVGHLELGLVVVGDIRVGLFAALDDGVGAGTVDALDARVAEGNLGAALADLGVGLGPAPAGGDGEAEIFELFGEEGSLVAVVGFDAGRRRKGGRGGSIRVEG